MEIRDIFNQHSSERKSQLEMILNFHKIIFGSEERDI